MQNLPDRAIERKRAKLRLSYPASRADAVARGRMAYYDDALCNKCGTRAVRRAKDDACMGCNGRGPYVGERSFHIKRRSVDRKIGYGADPTLITPKGKLILMPAKHWHKTYRSTQS